MKNRADNSSLLPPILQVVVDTEEEFDWNKPVCRDSISVQAMKQLNLGQSLLDEYAIRPVYVVDYPIVTQEAGFRPLQEIVHTSRAILGTHLHPWVNPPHLETLSSKHSYPGNLPLELEAKKLQQLTEKIIQTFGVTPLIYKAGRYGFGPNTATLLENQGYLVDLSPSPPYDFRGDGGPDYAHFSNHPVWFGQKRCLLSIPTTGAYTGYWRWHPHQLYTLATQPLIRQLRLPGILSRLNILDRIRLSPEGFELSDLCQLTHTLLNQGVRIFTLSFHSPSLKPGCTPYVRSESDLQRFLNRIRAYLDFFFGKLGGISETPLQIYDRLKPSDSP